MKLKELIESYYPGWYHIGEKGITKENINIYKPRTTEESLGKPLGGFWLAKGLSWHNWNSGRPRYNPAGSGSFASATKARETQRQHLYRVYLSRKKGKILHLPQNEKALKKYQTFPYLKDPVTGKSSFKAVDWGAVGKDYDAVQLDTLKASNIYGQWSVPSIAVFDKKIIDKIEYIEPMRPISALKYKIKKSKK